MPAGHVLIVGAGAAGLMAGRELARAGKRVTILEARDRCGGRIWPLRVADLGYAAEGGAEFIHGAAPLTRALVREARLALSPVEGRRWSASNGAFSSGDARASYNRRLNQALAAVKTDLPIAEFLRTRFPGQGYADLRQSITRMVEGYDAADPERASTLALRDEWMSEGLGQQDRIAEGYGALIAFLAAECQRFGAAIHLGAAVAAIEGNLGRIVARCRDGATIAADAAILTQPLPLLADIALPPAARAKLAAGGDIGFGNVVKILLRFRTKWWAGHGGRDLADLSFLLSGAPIPTWWTQHPAEHPVLTGWFAGPRADKVAGLSANQLVEMGLASLGEIFALPLDRLTQDLVATQAINWGSDPFARGAYSYATPKTREAQSALKKPDGGAVFFSGEALHAGRDMGTVEAALASGLETAQAISAPAP